MKTPKKKPNKTRVIVPDDILFADLQLFRDENGDVRYNPETMNKVIEASQVDPGLLLQWSNMSALLVAWHDRAVKDGQPPDPVMTQMISEVMDEIGRGQGHRAGHA